MKLFLVTASTGGGHLAANRALEAEATRQGIETVSIDAMDYVNKAFRAWFRGGYETLVKRNPKLWGHLYKSADRPWFNYHTQTAMDFAFSARITQMAKDANADWVVCTHSVAQPHLPRSGIPMAVVVTDLYPHRMWLRGKPNLFCVATEWSLEQLHKRVPGANGVITGIPISPCFTPGADPSEPTVIVAAGGIGGGPVREVVARLAGVAHIHVLTGWNTKLLNSLQNDRLRGVTLHGHLTSEEVSYLMQRASVLVSKPGGLTTSEALAVGVPFVVYDPFMIPGQEEQNAAFLVASGSGARARNLTELGQLIPALLGDSGRRKQMRSTSLANGNPAAAANVIAALQQARR